MAITPRVRVPDTAAVGETVLIKALINHPMESGQRRDRDTGERIPRMIIHTFEVTFNGREVVTFYPQGAVSQGPFFEFYLKVPEAGELNFKWTDDEGSVFEISKSIAIS